MVKVKTDVKGNPLPCEIYLDGTEKKNLDALRLKQKKKWDVIGIVVGSEGDGKSVYAMQRALYFDANFNIDNIVFTSKDFLDAVNDKEKFPNGSCILWDEADDLGDHWASSITKTLTKTFKRIRKRQLFILLVTPTFFDLNKYFAIHRLRFLIHIHSSGLDRGFFRFFSSRRKKDLYIFGKQMWNMRLPNVKSNFIGRFTKLPKDFPVDFSEDGEYETKKDSATAELGDLLFSKKDMEIHLRKKFVLSLWNNLFLEKIKPSQRIISNLLGLSRDQVRGDIEKLKKEGLMPP